MIQLTATPRYTIVTCKFSRLGKSGVKTETNKMESQKRAEWTQWIPQYPKRRMVAIKKLGYSVFNVPFDAFAFYNCAVILSSPSSSPSFRLPGLELSVC